MLRRLLIAVAEKKEEGEGVGGHKRTSFVRIHPPTPTCARVISFGLGDCRARFLDDEESRRDFAVQWGKRGGEKGSRGSTHVLFVWQDSLEKQ